MRIIVPMRVPGILFLSLIVIKRFADDVFHLIDPCGVVCLATSIFFCNHRVETVQSCLVFIIIKNWKSIIFNI